MDEESKLRQMAKPDELDRLYRCVGELNQVVNRGAELSVLLDTIIRSSAELLEADTGSVMLLGNHERLLMSASSGLSDEERRRISFRPGEGVAGWVVAMGKPAVIDDAEQDGRFKRIEFQGRRIRGMLAIPLMVRGQAIGVICVTHPEPGHFAPEHAQLLTFLAHSVILDVENARLYRMATTDGLTGLYNRQHLSKRLKEEVERAHRYQSPLALLMGDLDHFKQINDLHGHPTGDIVLRQVALEMLELTREVDLLCRYGGEEFVVVLPSTDRTGAAQAADRLLKRVRELSIGVRDATIAVTMSIGGALIQADETPDELLARADEALYQAKASGRDRVVFHSGTAGRC